MRVIPGLFLGIEVSAFGEFLGVQERLEIWTVGSKKSACHQPFTTGG